MSCEFIERYLDKLYAGDMNRTDRKELNRHCDSCEECRHRSEKILNGSSYIKDVILDVNVPPSLSYSVSNSIMERGQKNRRAMNIKRYLAAAAVLLVVISSSIYYFTRNMGQNGLTSQGNNLSGPGIAVPDKDQMPAELSNVLKSYIKEKYGTTTKNGQVFVSLDVFGTDEKDGAVKVYLWALIQEYAWVQGLIEEGGSSIPMVIELEKSGNEYTPKSVEIPRDGTYYPEDVKKLFPGSYREKVSARQGNVFDLEQQNKQQAMEYFKSNTTPQNGASIQKTIADFLDIYGWHSNGAEYTQNIKIPLTFVDKPGEIPAGLYFAYNNVLSKSIGYDMERYKGMDVKAHIINLKEEFGEGPNKNVRAIVIEVAGSIGGAWLDRGRSGYLASLDKKYFGDITGKSWGQWLIDEGLVDYSQKGFEGKMNKLTPEEVIQKYYDTIAKKDFKSAFSMLAKSNQMGYLYINMPDDKLYNDDSQSYYGGLENITSVKVSGIKEYNLEITEIPDKTFNRLIFARKQYQVDTDMTFKQEIVRSNGSNPWFIGMVKESSNAPWLIEGIGTGP